MCASCHAGSVKCFDVSSFPDKWCSIAMDGTSAINILYQYPLWSLSQSAEMTFVICLFCCYRIWHFLGMWVLILLMYRARCWPTCVFVFCVCFTGNLSSSEKMCEHEIQWVNTGRISDMAEEAGWIIVQNTFLKLFNYVGFRWNDQIWQFYNVITGMLKFL